MNTNLIKKSGNIKNTMKAYAMQKAGPPDRQTGGYSVGQSMVLTLEALYFLADVIEEQAKIISNLNTSVSEMKREMRGQR